MVKPAVMAIMVALPLLALLMPCAAAGASDGTGTIADTADIVVDFPDPNLEAAVRSAIGKTSGDIYRSDVGSLSRLTAVGRDINDLTGLEHCTGLNMLRLRFNRISDLSPLANLYSLKELYLEENEISDLTPLSGLLGLRYLKLCGNRLSDISPLSSLTGLTYLTLTDNEISDLTPLAGLTGLGRLCLWNNRISDLTPLTGLPELYRLYLFWNEISDISPLLENSGLGEGDVVQVMGNPLSRESLEVYIPQLIERGVACWPYYSAESENGSSVLRFGIIVGVVLVSWLTVGVVVMRRRARAV